MIQNDTELAVTQERIAVFVQLLAQLRVNSRVEEFPFVSSGYRIEVEKMQHEVLNYLSRHATQTAKAG